MLERQRERDERKDALVAALNSFINGADSSEIAEFATDIARDHRTLVQRKFGLFLQFCKVLDADFMRGTYDARNEYACKLAHEVMKMTEGTTGVPNV